MFKKAPGISEYKANIKVFDFLNVPFIFDLYFTKGLATPRLVCSERYFFWHKEHLEYIQVLKQAYDYWIRFASTEAMRTAIFDGLDKMDVVFLEKIIEIDC